jgi:hypothetical protein
MRLAIRRSLPVLLLLAALTAPSSAAAAPTAEASRTCDVGRSTSYGTTYVLSITTRYVRCARAKDLVRAFHRCRQGPRGRCASVWGYSCSEYRFNKSALSFDSRVRCARSGKVVRHRYTQFL